MKATKIMDSLNYLDDDLLLESEKKSVAKITPLNDRKKKSVITGLSIAASFVLVSTIALVLILSVGDYLTRAKSASEDVQTHNGNIESVSGAEEYFDEPEFAPETEAACDDSEEVDGETEYQVFIVYNSELYCLSELQFNPDVDLKPIGEVEESSLEEYIGCQIYAYEESSIIVEYDGEYMLFEKAE